MHIDKAEIITTLRSRGLHARASWVERTLPLLVDVHKNRSLLETLDLDPATMSSVDPSDPAAEPTSQEIRHERAACR
jgi:hypothetical protein